MITEFFWHPPKFYVQGKCFTPLSWSHNYSTSHVMHLISRYTHWVGLTIMPSLQVRKLSGGGGFQCPPPIPQGFTVPCIPKVTAGPRDSAPGPLPWSPGNGLSAWVKRCCRVKACRGSPPPLLAEEEHPRTPPSSPGGAALRLATCFGLSSNLLLPTLSSLPSLSCFLHPDQCFLGSPPK